MQQASGVWVRLGQLIDVLHWPLVVLLLLGPDLVSQRVWIGFLALTVGLQTAYRGCPLVAWSDALRRRCQPDYQRQGPSLVSLAFRGPRLLGAAVSLVVLVLASQLLLVLVHHGL